MEPDERELIAAHDAGLRYVTDAMPGIHRSRARGKWRYTRADGTRVTDSATLERIAKLAIPPAYASVWICPLANGHLQATGRDARGRKQYRYHARWREARDATKFERLLEFAAVLPRIRKALGRDLTRPRMPKEKVLAAVVTLLETTLIRVGNEEYVRANESFGLTTLRNRHVRVRGANLRFEFKGKSGQQHRVDLHDRRLARIVAQCQDLPGQQLFTFADEQNNPVPIDSADVNEYIRATSGTDFSAKDFRTWLATVCCAQWLGSNPAHDDGERAANAVAATKAVARRLHNTPAICRKCYIHPALFERYLESGELAVPLPASRTNGLRPEERMALAVLRASARQSKNGSQKRVKRKRESRTAPVAGSEARG